MHTHVRRALATTIALGAGALLAVAAPLAASAHVTLQGNTAAPGSYTLLTFKVPNEETTGATTDRISISLPTDHPFVSASYVPVPGWTATATRTTLPKPIVNGDSTITQAVTEITWTADAGQGIPQGALGLFQLSVGPVPSVGSIELPAEQSYSDGTVVSWSQKGEGAEHPAPVLYVNDAPPVKAATGPLASATATPVIGTTTASSSDVVARVFGVGGLVVGVIGLIVGIAGLRRRAATGADS